MSSIILELQELAANSDCNVEELLNKTYMVARKLDIQTLISWCESELFGYTTENLPLYRKFYGDLMLYHEYYGLKPFFIPDDVKEIVSLINYKSPISEIENFILNSEGKFIERVLPYEAKKILMEIQSNPIKLEPKLIVSRTDLMNMKSKIKLTILDWALKLEKEGILGEGIQFSTSEKEKAMTTQFHIQNMQGFVGNISGGNMQQNIYDGIHIEANNFDQLADFLSKNGIPSSELSSLKEAIDLDEKPTEANKFGTNVSQWIGRIMAKASNGTINIALSTIAGLLTNAISQYYGLI